MLPMSVSDNISLATLKRMTRGVVIDRATRRAASRR